MDHKKSENPSSSSEVIFDQASCSSNYEEALIEDEMLIEDEEMLIEDEEMLIEDKEMLIEDEVLIKDEEEALIEDVLIRDIDYSLEDEENNLLDDEEIVVEETLIQVSIDDPDEMSSVNSNSIVRVIALETDSPVLQIENKVFGFNEWKYIQGTAMFFEPKKVAKTTESLFDKRCETELQYIGSTHKCLEMTKNDRATHSN